MKIKALKDLPGFPAGTVFYLEDNREGRPVWHWHYKQNRALVGSDWLAELLSYQIPEVSDDYTDFFEQVVEKGDRYYAVNFDGTVTEFTVYTWWGNPDAPNVFKSRFLAEKIAGRIDTMIRTAHRSEVLDRG